MQILSECDKSFWFRCKKCTAAQRVMGDNPACETEKIGDVYYHHTDLVHCCDDKLVVSFGREHMCPKCGPHIPLLT